MSLDPSFASPFHFDQTNPVFWQNQTADVDLVATRLSGLLWQGRQWLEWYDAYYEGEQPLSYMSPAMARELQGQLRAVVLNWPRLVVEAYVARMKVDGFRFKGSEDTDADLWAVWQANNLDKLSRQALLEMLALGRSYIIVGAPEVPGDLPVVTVESPFQVTAVRDPKTRRVTEALKRWRDLDLQEWATLYLPDRTVTLRADGAHWVTVSSDDHNLGVVPVVPLVNRARILRPNGVSEFHDVIPIVDAAIKNATDMMIAAEYHAMPRRWVFGLKAEDFKDQNGNRVSMWSKIAGRIWSSENKDVNVGQFPEAMLSNFHETIKLLAQLASQVAALPANYLAFNNVNPTSADAMRAIDSQLELRIEGKKLDNGEDFEDVMRLVLAFQNGGTFDPAAKSIETVWANSGTLTTSQKMDAAVKGVASKIVTVEQAREDLGYGPIARERMAAADRRGSVLGLTSALTDQFGQAADGSPAA